MSDAHPHAVEPDWVHGHRHEPNPHPPPGDATIRWSAAGQERLLSPAFLATLPRVEVAGCFIVSTGHGASGPFTFGGVALRELLATLLPAGFAWRYVDVVSGDGFGTRLTPADVLLTPAERPVLLADTLDGAPLTRAAGLVRLIVPTETDDALKQVKWIARIEVV
ncbi:MAG TPA: molybdopterin-dependent oxidoreductase [Chloroflexi bacterium]|nr:molybdopterin-dependent oxidoreductase [Chloroflexota bacterium]